MHGAIAEAQLPLLLMLSTYIHVGNAGAVAEKPRMATLRSRFSDIPTSYAA
jgi:hypothetical protein